MNCNKIIKIKELREFLHKKEASGMILWQRLCKAYKWYEKRLIVNKN